jgi:hypothetical protein
MLLKQQRDGDVVEATGTNHTAVIYSHCMLQNANPQVMIIPTFIMYNI